jgi:hypothetical protein
MEVSGQLHVPAALPPGTNQQTNSMEHSPSSEANSHSASQESLCLVWNLKVHYSVHNGLPPVFILNQVHPVHIFPPYFPSRFPTKILNSFLTSYLRATCPAHHTNVNMYFWKLLGIRCPVSQMVQEILSNGFMTFL